MRRGGRAHAVDELDAIGFARAVAPHDVVELDDERACTGEWRRARKGDRLDRGEAFIDARWLELATVAKLRAGADLLLSRELVGFEQAAVAFDHARGGVVLRVFERGLGDHAAHREAVTPRDRKHLGATHAWGTCDLVRLRAVRRLK